MLDRLTGKPIHLYIAVLSCALVAAGLPLNKILMSLGTMLGFLNLFLEGNYRLYWKNLRENRIAWGLWAFIFFEWLSLFWSQNMDYALHDFKIKLPIYGIPLFLVARPITNKRFYHAFGIIFLTSLLLTSVINVGSYQHWWGNRSYDDIRGMSLFCSHIRYALMIAMGIVICLFWMIAKLRHKWLAFILLMWFITYTWLSQVLSGYLALGGISVVIVMLAIVWIRSTPARVVIFGTSIATVFVLGGLLTSFLKPIPHKMDLKNLPVTTANGRIYWNDTINPLWENGYPIIAFINQEELAQGWNKVSAIDYWEGTDKKQQTLRFTLWRYMTSLGWTKDSVGFLKMSSADVQNVERGIASIRLTGGGLKSRLSGIQYQLENRENPNGHSLLQRLEYWKAGQSIIGQHLVFGVGSGDVQDEFDQYYAANNSRLNEDLRHRAHNQYMTSWITSGIGGFVGFLAWWLLFLLFGWKNRDFLILGFAAIAMTSFLIEDTIETQAGVTFIALFYGLLVSSRCYSTTEESV